MTSCVARLLDEYGLKPRFLNYLEQIFDGVEVQGGTLLDVGAGNGTFSLFAGCLGARVVALEPEAEGSRSDMRMSFERARGALDLGDVELLPLALQDFEPGQRLFDVVLMHNVINHLDESACRILHLDEDAQRSYEAILRHLSSMVAPGGSVVVKDVARRNLWGDLRIRNPISPSLDWEKHQAPRVWASLLEKAGFKVTRTRWLVPHRLPDIVRKVLGNPYGAYLFTSAFVINAVNVGSAHA